MKSGVVRGLHAPSPRLGLIVGAAQGGCPHQACHPQSALTAAPKPREAAPSRILPSKSQDTNARRIDRWVCGGWPRTFGAQPALLAREPEARPERGLKIESLKTRVLLVVQGCVRHDDAPTGEGDVHALESEHGRALGRPADSPEMMYMQAGGRRV